jgi:hypothetical protein
MSMPCIKNDVPDTCKPFALDIDGEGLLRGPWSLLEFEQVFGGATVIIIQRRGSLLWFCDLLLSTCSCFIFQP